jgi:hypothetical protein
MEQLFELSRELARAQADAAGDTLRELTAQRRQIENALMRRAVALGTQAGVRVSDSVVREAQETLSAALAVPEVADEVRSGQLVKPTSYAGFGSVSPGAVAPRPPAAPIDLDAVRLRRAAGPSAPAPADSTTAQSAGPSAAAPAGATTTRPPGTDQDTSTEEQHRQEQGPAEAVRRAEDERRAEAERQRAAEEERLRASAERRAAAERRLAQARRDAQRASTSLVDAARAVEDAADRARDLRQQVETLRRQLARVEAEAQRADEAATEAEALQRQAEEANTQATEAVAVAERDLAAENATS